MRRRACEGLSAGMSCAAWDIWALDGMHMRAAGYWHHRWLMHPLQAPRSHTQCLCLMPVYGSTAGLCTLQEANVPVWFRIFVRLIFRWLVAYGATCDLLDLMAASWQHPGSCWHYWDHTRAEYAKHTSVLEMETSIEIHSGCKWNQLRAMTLWVKVTPPRRPEFHQLHSASSRARTLLELHGFDGQISAPILSNNILHASRGGLSQQLVILVKFVLFPC
jgi:hypothetical protein